MKNKTRHICLLGLIVSIFFNGSAAFAGSKLIIKPIIDTSYMIDSNFYKTNTNERTVSTLTISPGVEIGGKTEKSKLTIKGLLNLTYYDDLDSLSSGMTDSDENDFTGHHLTLSADTQLFTRIKAGLDDTWINTRNPSERDALDNFTDVDEYTLNRIRPWIKYQISDRIAAGFEFKNTLIDYSLATDEDVSTTGGKANLYYDLNKFTTIDLEYQLWETDYDLTSSDYTSQQYGINLESKFKYFKLRGGAGYHDRDFDQSSLSDIDTLSWNISVKGQNPADLDPEERPRSYLDLAFAQNFNNTGTSDEYYIANRVSLTAGHLFLEKIDAKITSYFQKSDYENNSQNREDDTWSVSGTLTYYMNDWMTLSFKTGYETRDSSIEINDYDNSYALFRVTFNYDLGSK